MYIFKYAYLSVIRNKGRNILIGLIGIFWGFDDVLFIRINYSIRYWPTAV